MQAEFVTKLHIKAEEEGDCWITGLATISADEILLVDYYNSSIKIYNVKENTITSRYTSTSKPWGAAVINSETFAVTLPYTDKLLFLSTLKELTESHRIKVKNGCYGIDHSKGIIAISSVWPPVVQILDLRGFILREIKNIISYPGDIHVSLSHDGREVFVSATNDNAVYQLTTDGILKTTMDQDLKSVRGITVSSKGTVFVCSDSIKENSDRVCMILPALRKIVPVSVENVLKPCCIVFCELKKKLYISESGNTTDCNYIKTYDWKYTEHI